MKVHQDMHFNKNLVLTSKHFAQKMPYMKCLLNVLTMPAMTCVQCWK